MLFQDDEMGNVMKSLDDNSVAKDTLIMYADPASFAQGPLLQGYDP